MRSLLTLSRSPSPSLTIRPHEEPTPDPPTPTGPISTEPVGSAQRIGTSSYNVVNLGGRFPGTFVGSRPIYDLGDWGVEATQGTSMLFKAVIRESTGIFSTGDYELHIEGKPTGSNPVSGSAVWTGHVRAYDAHPEKLGTPVSGDARLEANLGAATVDVSFTGFSGGHADMSWRALRLSNGAFGHRSGFESLDGAFYGAEHEGVAGSFMRDRLDGVFGATRE